MESNFKISIITVCRNSEKTIARTIESLLKQKVAFEYVVIDGASTDNTMDVVNNYKPFLEKKGNRVLVISERDFGIYDAMNKGVKLCSGEIIGILNSDDFYEENTLHLIENAMNVHTNVDIFYGLLRVVMEDGMELQVYRYVYENYLGKIGLGCESAAQHPTCFVRRSLYERIGSFDTSFPTAADYDFLLRAKLFGAKFFGQNEVFTNFSNTGISNQISNYHKIEQRYKIHLKHNLISTEEFNQFLKYETYTRIKGLKLKFFEYLFGKIR